MKNKKIKIIGVPMDLGQSKRGVDMGPSAMCYADLSKRLTELGYVIKDAGNIDVPVKESLDKKIVVNEIQKACETVYKTAQHAIKDGYIPIFLGGDHSISIGSIGGITHDDKVGLIWIDSHGDFNTKATSLSGNIHGMSLAILTGHGSGDLVNTGRDGAKIAPEDIVSIGVRDLDPKERDALKKSGIKVFTMRDIDEQGISAVMKKALSYLKPKRIHVSLDMDCLDPATAPGVGTLASGGLTYREAHLLMEVIADSKRLSSLDIVEINPLEDNGNRTAQVACELAVSLFGKSIL